MLIKAIQIRCDTLTCGETSAVADGAIFTKGELQRTLHRDRGWSRQYKPSRDLCPKCTRKYARKYKQAKAHPSLFGQGEAI